MFLISALTDYKTIKNYKIKVHNRSVSPNGSPNGLLSSYLSTHTYKLICSYCYTEQHTTSHYVCSVFIIIFMCLQVIAYNSEGKSSPSETVDYATCPDKPGVPSKPSVKGKIHAQSFKIVWGKNVDQLFLEFVLCFLFMFICKRPDFTSIYFSQLSHHGKILIQNT